MTKIIVVGAGPGGIAAAVQARQCGAQVTILDENPRPGGQIWRQGPGAKGPPKAARRWLEQLQSLEIPILGGATALEEQGSQLLYYHDEQGLKRLSFDALILATGARELFLPFPGWTLPGVTGCGALQALVKSGLPIKNKRVIIAGTGPLLLAVAAQIKKAGAKVSHIVEQASRRQYLRFAQSLLTQPGKLLEGVKLRSQCRSSKLSFNSWITQVQPHDGALRCALEQGPTSQLITADYLACGFGLTPNTELAQILGCATSPHGVKVDDACRSSQPKIYAVGEAIGVGGVELALLEGQIAAAHACGQPKRARSQSARRRALLSFRQTLRRCFALRPEVKALARPETILCRCEDVTLEQISKFKGQRAAKLGARMAMGPCQGRVCGPIGRELFGWQDNSVRSPLCPIPVKALCSLSPNQT